jgi:SPP1 gp7 family putative phage head morphogenesis protein
LASDKVEAGIGVYDILISALNELVNKAGSYSEFEAAIPTLVSVQFINSLGTLLTDSLTAADSIGRSEIVNKDKEFSDGKKVLSAKFKIGKHVARADGIRWISAADSGVKISFDLTPKNALDYFRNKAFWISGIENEKFIAEVKRSLERALSDGSTYQEFVNNFRQLYQSYGIVPDNAIRIDTIFRTNLFTSYTAGLVKQVDQVKESFPVWRYVSILDNRTRQSHRNLNGKLFRNGPYPPISFNCRCTPQFLHKFQLDKISEPVSDSIYDFIDPEEVVDFLSGNSWDSWLADNPVSSEIQTIVEDALS